jgi:hypothetical protein
LSLSAAVIKSNLITAEVDPNATQRARKVSASASARFAPIPPPHDQWDKKGAMPKRYWFAVALPHTASKGNLLQARIGVGIGTGANMETEG